MSFPPSFLEELRARVPLIERVMRRVRLARHGREYQGLCPFHNEKSPSFTVSEEKGFFHCFGCGAHGDVIGFVMRIDNLDFLEAIERLAAEAGIEVPKSSPAAREMAVRAKTLHEVLEAACVFYEEMLAAREGLAARNYLAERDLNEAAARRFRLGYAPTDSKALRRHLLKDYPASLVEEAGLMRTPDDGRDSFDYFRDRLMFPILDKRGRVVAFGGRVFGDAKPKYLNSPEGPLFHKGEQLYGASWARDGVHAGSELIVTEGYIDVMRLHLAGFAGAVAPLGTALTEKQLEQLWSLAPEPILCFDGDAAGQRAASRALDRAMPLLKPGKSLRFAALPTGEDPDSLIRRRGAPAMQGILAAAKPLAEILWEQELARGPADTPERRSDLERRLMEHVAQINDASVKREYQSYYRSALYERSRNRWASRQAGKGKPFSKGGKPVNDGRRMAGLPSLPDVAAAEMLQQEVLVRLILDLPELLDEVLEQFASLTFSSPELDRVRAEIIKFNAAAATLDSERLKEHLTLNGFGGALARLYAPDVSVHVMFAKAGTDKDIALRGIQQAFNIWRSKHDRVAEQEDAIRRFSDQPSDEAWAHVQALPAISERELIEQAEFENTEADQKLPH